MLLMMSKPCQSGTSKNPICQLGGPDCKPLLNEPTDFGDKTAFFMCLCDCLSLAMIPRLKAMEELPSVAIASLTAGKAWVVKHAKVASFCNSERIYLLYY